MPTHLRALVVILVLATVVFVFAKAPASAIASAPADFERRRNLWFAIVLAAFLAHNFWIYIIVAAVLPLLAVPREQNKLAMFFFLLLALPPIPAQIPAFGPIKQFFVIDYYRLLSLTVLLPAYLILRKQVGTEHFGRLLPDKLMAGYLIYNFLLMLMATSLTNALRGGAFYPFLDVFLPYYVASRSLKHLEGFRDALMAFVVAGLAISLIAVFESTNHWLLYASLDDALGVPWTGRYLQRGALTRAVASAGQPIPLGYAIAVSIGFFLYIRKSVPSQMACGLALVLLITGIIATVSRGPWVGAAVILLVFIATGRSPMLHLTKLGLLALAVLSLLLAAPGGHEIITRIIDFLPFIGTVDAINVSYRQRLFEIAVQIIIENPLLGASNFYYSPAMSELAHGGFIDLLNTPMTIGMSGGLVALSLFGGFFIAALFQIFKSMRSLADKDSEKHLLGQALFSTLLGALVIIFTVSSISCIPVIYWSLAGLGVGYARMLAHDKTLAAAPEVHGLRNSTRPVPVQQSAGMGSHVRYRNQPPRTRNS